jgi:Ca2+-binding RTX toxin-like protein
MSIVNTYGITTTALNTRSFFPTWDYGGTTGVVTSAFTFDAASVTNFSFDIKVGGYTIRYLGFGISGNATGPLSGTVTSMEMRSFDGTVLLADLTGFFSFNALDFNTAMTSAAVFAGTDTITGNNGNDSLIGFAGSDRILGGLGNDTLVSGADSTIEQFFDGGDGTDLLRIDRTGATVGISISLGSPSGSINDVAGFWSFDNFERLDFTGGSGDDTVTGGNGADILDGGLGSDTIQGGDGNDFVRSGSGNTLEVGFDGGSGVNTLSFSRSTSSTGFGTSWTGGGFFITDIGGSWNAANMQILTAGGSLGNDTIQGGAGDDFIYGNAGVNQLDGGGGIDTLSIFWSALTTNVTFSSASLLGFFGFTFNQAAANDFGSTAINFERVSISTGSGNDSITAGAYGDSISGNGGNDTLVGGIGADFFQGGDGDDSLTGSAGNDSIQGGIGADFIDGGADADQLGGNDGNDTIFGGAGNDTIFGNDGDNDLSGDADADSILGGNNIDTLSGGTGNDTLRGASGNDVLNGGEDDDSIDGGVGSDQISYSQSSGVNLTLAAGGSGTFTVAGWGTDTYFSIEGIDGSATGADTLVGNSGDNLLRGFNGKDSLDGGLGIDTLDGGEGNDTLVSGDGNTLEGGFIGGNGNDIAAITRYSATASLNISLTSVTDVGGTWALTSIEGLGVTTGTGNDTVTGGGLGDTILDYGGSNTFSTGAGQDTILFLGVPGGVQVVDGGSDTDYLDFTTDLTASQTFNGSNPALIQTLTNGTSIVNFEVYALRFGTGNDTITGGAFDDFISGGGGADSLTGGAGADSLEGGAGNDVFVIASQADDANDSLIGGADLDTLRWTGTGNADLGTMTVSSVERIEFAGGASTLFLRSSQFGTGFSNSLAVVGDTNFNAVYVSMAAAGSFSLAGWTLSNWASSDVLYVYGSFGGDSITGSAGRDILSGERGADTIFGGGGDDYIVSNTLNAVDAQGDSLSGDAGNDTIFGGQASDTLLGGADNDTLAGGSGSDTLDGGTGSDTASYSNAQATVQVFMYNMTYNTGDALGDVFTSIEALEGSANVDILVGSFLGDSIFGGNGGDWLDGTYGGDSLFGQAGNDSLVSRVQVDILDGGADFDFARYDYADAALRAYIYDTTQNTGWAAGDTFVSIEGLAGSYFADDLRGDNNQNIIYGLGGADYVIGLGGSDLLIGGDGQDLFHFVGITDGGAGGDAIQDFVSGFDRISVTGQFFGLGSPGGVAIDSFRFVAGAAANLATSQFIYNNATQQLFYDIDGTGAGVQVLLATLQAGATLAAGDIIVI